MVVVMLVLLGAAAPAGPTTAVSPELLEAAAARGAARVVVQLTVPEGAAAAAIEAAKQALWTDLGAPATASYGISPDSPWWSSRPLSRRWERWRLRATLPTWPETRSGAPT